MKSGKTLLTADIAERFNVSSVTAWNWCNAGLFPNAKKTETPRGYVWEIPESDLKEFVQPRRGRPVDPNPSEITLAKRRSRPLKRLAGGKRV